MTAKTQTAEKLGAGTDQPHQETASKGQVALTDQGPVAILKAGLEQMRPNLKVALPSHISVERFERVVLTAINQNPDLMQADRRSLFNSCQKAAQDGLLPDGREAALVIFNTKIKRNGREEWIKSVQYMPMVFGIIKKVRQSGEVVELRSRVVYRKDQFAYSLGDEETIAHTPFMGDAGEPIAVYAIAKGKDGWIEREVMTVAEVERVRSVSKARDKGPWVDWWTEMARKTVIRRLSKRLPLSAEIFDAMGRDDELAREVLLDLPPRPTRDQIEAHHEPEAEEPEATPEEIAEAEAAARRMDQEAEAIATGKIATDEGHDPETGEVNEVTDKATDILGPWPKDEPAQAAWRKHAAETIDKAPDLAELARIEEECQALGLPDVISGEAGRLIKARRKKLPAKTEGGK